MYMSEEDRNREKTMPKEKERKEDTNTAEGLNRGDMAAQEQKRIFRQAKE
jgi:hypothetical protein